MWVASIFHYIFLDISLSSYTVSFKTMYNKDLIGDERVYQSNHPHPKAGMIAKPLEFNWTQQRTKGKTWMKKVKKKTIKSLDSGAQLYGNRSHMQIALKIMWWQQNYVKSLLVSLLRCMRLDRFHGRSVVCLIRVYCSRNQWTLENFTSQKFDNILIPYSHLVSNYKTRDMNQWLFQRGYF